MAETTTDLVRCRVAVHGLVQGVWFRESCRREATARGVTGWVRNRADGSVEAEFVGSHGDVAAVVSWCRIGPPRAEVAGVDVVEEVTVTADEVPHYFAVR